MAYISTTWFPWQGLCCVSSLSLAAFALHAVLVAVLRNYLFQQRARYIVRTFDEPHATSIISLLLDLQSSYSARRRPPEEMVAITCAGARARTRPGSDHASFCGRQTLLPFSSCIETLTSIIIAMSTAPTAGSTFTASSTTSSRPRSCPLHHGQDVDRVFGVSAMANAPQKNFQSGFLPCVSPNTAGSTTNCLTASMMMDVCPSREISIPTGLCVRY
jgi:hypothetical protein